MSKLIVSAVLLFVSVSGAPAYATVKYYQYNGNLPFIEMMLNMMTTMGILDKVPVNYMNDIAYSRFNNYYPGAMGVGPGAINPYNSSSSYGPWLRPVSVSPAFNCRSILCGDRAYLLNGLWVAPNGEMLGIRNHKFIWNNSDRRYVKGTLRARNGLMLASPYGVNTPIQYQYKINHDQLMMRDRNGLVKRFRKVRSRRL